jgi:mannose-6-phosphate isomerase-like protein (cupin superfamily)
MLAACRQRHPSSSRPVSRRDFVHDVDELVTVVEGRLRLEIGAKSVEAGPGDEVFIPKGANHSVFNIHRGTTRWLFGYRRG